MSEYDNGEILVVLENQDVKLIFPTVFFKKEELDVLQQKCCPRKKVFRLKVRVPRNRDEDFIPNPRAGG